MGSNYKILERGLQSCDTLPLKTLARMSLSMLGIILLYLQMTGLSRAPMKRLEECLYTTLILLAFRLFPKSILMLSDVTAARACTIRLRTRS